MLEGFSMLSSLRESHLSLLRRSKPTDYGKGLLIHNPGIDEQGSICGRLCTEEITLLLDKFLRDEELYTLLNQTESQNELRK